MLADAVSQLLRSAGPYALLPCSIAEPWRETLQARFSPLHARPDHRRWTKHCSRPERQRMPLTPASGDLAQLQRAGEAERTLRRSAELLGDHPAREEWWLKRIAPCCHLPATWSSWFAY